MHETHLFKHIPAFLAQEEEKSGKKVKTLYATISEFGSFKEPQVHEHVKDALKSSKWEGMNLVVITIPFGPDFEITKIEFE
jgi:Zn finger protein HypA/HybF involved in hydrogenase expression